MNWKRYGKKTVRPVIEGLACRYWPVTLADISAEIRTGNLLNRSIERYRYSILFIVAHLAVPRIWSEESRRRSLSAVLVKYRKFLSPLCINR
jgi:hypothetical protein